MLLFTLAQCSKDRNGLYFCKDENKWRPGKVKDLQFYSEFKKKLFFSTDANLTLSIFIYETGVDIKVIHTDLSLYLWNDIFFENWEANSIFIKSQKV